MNKFSRILIKIFCVTSVILYSHDSFSAVQTGNILTLKLCNPGYYVSKCGDYFLGTNWLKGYKLSNGTTSDWNYYDYSGINNLKNLRLFFHGNEDIIYTKQTPEDGIGGRDSVAFAEYSQKRDELLLLLCDPSEVEILCAKCPSDGKVSRSTVNKRLNTTVINDMYSDWKIYTVADCYMDTFSDSTGTYVYDSADSTPAHCTYSVENVGSSLTNVNSSNAGTIITPGYDGDTEENTQPENI